ncbi:efflux RND transporter periplasmic adaptor subunit [Actinomadura opuntiae]|uniref:efflux RND transporter periplasmic adaptor subunit n=1 Tax=Actinomadura sp. OS1-43 TaxID=604315 RepID=UPI00255AA871|nr:HlyD family efflux transporter periplasmic adaptor subunit [Actinomadura sp. OS1-43]MDL4813772.1 HlyD family efflux transporter periplasmic adaptor subunit [Actinomadura sp. OS1-43]
MKWPFQRRTTLINGALGVLLVAGAGTAYLTLGDGGDDAAAATRVTRVQRGSVSASVSASGSVESARSGDLSFGTSGTVAKIYVKAGQKVPAGAVLARLDQTEALENVDEAKANLAAAEDGDTTSAKGYAGYLQVKNAYNSALRAYQGTVLKAPFAGTVTAVNGTVGGSSSGSGSSSSSSSSSSSGSGASSGSSGSSGSGASAGGGASSSSGSSSSGSGSGFIELTDTKHLQIEGDFTEADTTKLKVGQTASVSFDALTGKTATGKITEIGLSPTTSDNVVKFPVTISLTKVPSGVRLGQTATVEITTASADDVLYVPTAAVKTAGGQSTVTVVRNGKQVAVTVETGVKGDQGTEITSGLSEGDQVVVTSSTTGTSGSGAGQRGGLPGGGAPGGGFGGGAPGGGGGGRR